jgi:hypothetical protein
VKSFTAGFLIGALSLILGMLSYLRLGVLDIRADAPWIAKHGIRMTATSAYGSSYSDDQLWALAGFLHHIKTLPPGVLERIQAKNPASRN